MDLALFRAVNGIKQVELAEYLCVGKSYLSNVEAGRVRLSKENIKKLLENPNGWDTSMLGNDETYKEMFSEFLSANNIDIVELAKYLGLSKPYMSQIVSGAAKLADSRFQMLLDNPYGWDTSMLSRDKPEPTGRDSRPVSIRDDKDTDLKHALEMLELYKKMVEDLRKQIDFLQRMLERTNING